MNELPPKTQTPDSSRKIENSKIKILVADDEEFMRDIYNMTLSGMGYSIHVVKNGQELLDQLQKEKYNLLITDNNMPMVSGLEALEKIRANEHLNNLPRLPIILCSAGDAVKIKKIVEEKNAVFLAKSPNPVNAIEKTVERVLAEARDQKIKDRILALYKTGSFEKVHDDIVKHVKRLKEKYDDLMNYTVVHALIGSSVRFADHDLAESDLPGDDSIEKFVEALEEKYKKSTQ